MPDRKAGGSLGPEFLRQDLRSGAVFPFYEGEGMKEVELVRPVRTG